MLTSLPTAEPAMLFDINNHALRLTFSEELAPALQRVFRNFRLHDGATQADELEIRGDGNGKFLLRYKDAVLLEELTSETLFLHLCREIESIFAASSIDTVLRAGAVSEGEYAVLVAGPAGCGKSALTAWLLRRGFGYLADNCVSLASSYAEKHGRPAAISPLPLPLTMHPHREGAQQLDSAHIIQIADQAIIARPQAAEIGADQIADTRLAIYPCFHEGARLDISPLSAAEFQFLLAQSHHPNQTMTVFNASRIAAFAARVPAISVRFGSYRQLEGTLDRFIRQFLQEAPRPNLLRDFCGAWKGRQKKTPETTSAPETNPTRTWIKGTRPKLTIGMATLDDFDGAYFTLQSLRMHHREVVDDIEFLILDNNPDGPCAEPLRALEKKIPNYRYIPVRDRTGTAVRDIVMAESTSDYVLNLDCHVLLEPGAVAGLIRYFAENPDTNDLLQGPIVWDELSRCSTHMKPTWSAGFFGTWATDKRGKDPDNPPFEIPMQGLGLYACRRAAWPGFNPKFRGFGGEEGYLHEKFRQRGGKVLCLPFLRWLHRFYRPFGVPYKISWDDRIWNYLIGAKELNLDAQGVVEYFREYLGRGGHTLIDTIAQAVEAEAVSDAAAILPSTETAVASREHVRATAAPAHPFDRFDMIAFINLDRDAGKRRGMESRLRRLGLLQRAERFPAVETAENHHIGCALSHRNVLAEAKRRGVKNVLVLEDDAIFRQDTLDILPRVLDEVETVDMDLLFLGGRVWSDELQEVPGCSHLRVTEKITTTHAIVYDAAVFDRLLEVMPDTLEEMRNWIATHVAIDQYLCRAPYRKMISYPLLSIQPNLAAAPFVELEKFLKRDLFLSEF